MTEAHAGFRPQDWGLQRDLGCLRCNVSWKGRSRTRDGRVEYEQPCWVCHRADTIVAASVLEIPTRIAA